MGASTEFFSARVDAGCMCLELCVHVHLVQCVSHCPELCSTLGRGSLSVQGKYVQVLLWGLCLAKSTTVVVFVFRECTCQLSGLGAQMHLEIIVIVIDSPKCDTVTCCFANASPPSHYA